MPITDIFTTGAALVVKVELAGMRSEHFEVTVEGTRLRISGNRPGICLNLLRMMFQYGPFESVVEVPARYDLGKAKAGYLNGILRIDVPLRP